MPLSHGTWYGATTTAGTAPCPAISPVPGRESHHRHCPSYSLCHCVPRQHSHLQPHRPSTAQRPSAPRKAVGAETPVRAVWCSWSPLPHWGPAGPAARCHSAGRGRPPALATRPAHHLKGSRHRAERHVPPTSTTSLERGSLLPRGVAPARPHGLSGARVHRAGPSCAQQLPGAAARAAPGLGQH